MAVLSLSASGCSLLFTPAAAALDSGVDADVDPTISQALHTVAATGADFPDVEAWKSARGGDLGRRQELRVMADSGFAATELVTGDAGCQGTLRAQTDERPVDSRMTLDLIESSPVCVPGEILSSPSGAEAQIQQAGPLGTIEIVHLLDDSYDAPILLDSFQNTGPLAYLVVEADPEQPHRGLAGQGVVITNASLEEPSHGVDIRVPYTQLRGFEITRWAPDGLPASSFEGVHVEATEVLLDRLLIHDDGALADSNSDAITSQQDNASLTVRNSFIYNISRAGIMIQSSSNSTLRVQNCTLRNCVAADSQTDRYGCVALERGGDSNIEAINTLAFGQAVGKPAFILTNSPGSNFAGSSNNAADDGSQPGNDSVLIDTEGVFVSAEGAPDDDLHLSGDLLPTQPPYTGGTSQDPLFGDDIDGQLRGELWSIGADQP